MALSEVAICNVGLLKLGAGRIVNLTDDNVNARHCNIAYVPMRNRELRANAWNFSIQREILAADATAPKFNYAKAFVLPNGSLRLLLPPRLGLDWKIEDHNGQTAILSNDGTSLEIRYIATITDPLRFDPLFDDMLSCRIALEIMEAVTQSLSKLDAIKQEYKLLKAEAKRLNAFEQIPQDEPIDSWIAARQQGSVYATNRGWMVGVGGRDY